MSAPLFGGPLPAGRAILVAELSGNHNGSKARALELVHAAKEAGADAVKLQTYTADTITLDCDGPEFRIHGGPWDGRRLYELYQEASTPWAWHADLFAEAARLGLPCFSTPFDDTAVDFLEGLGCALYKVASFEVPDIPLLQRIGRTGKPVVMSTGMASHAEVAAAVTALREAGAGELCLLTCISRYPADPRELRLRNIAMLAQSFSCPAGLSDHSRSPAMAVAAVALGARLIEKHICLRRADGGPDAGFSLEPQEFAETVRLVRDAEAGLASAPFLGPGDGERENLVFRRSLFAVRDIAAGAMLTAADVRSIRPGHGLPPVELPRVIGRRARAAIARGTPLAWDLLA